VQDGVNDEDSEQNEVDGTKKGLIPQGDPCLKERLVVCNEKDTDGRTHRINYGRAMG